MITSNSPTPDSEKEWEEPTNPEAASDSRDKEQAERLIAEAKRQKENLTDPETEEQKQ